MGAEVKGSDLSGLGGGGPSNNPLDKLIAALDKNTDKLGVLDTHTKALEDAQKKIASAMETLASSIEALVAKLTEVKTLKSSGKSAAVANVEPLENPEIAAAEERAARAVWREGLEKAAELKMQAAMKELAEIGANNAAWEKITASRIDDEVKGEAAARLWREGLKKAEAMKLEAAEKELAAAIAADRELHQTDRGGVGPGNPPGPAGPKGDAKLDSRNILSSAIKFLVARMGPLGKVVAIASTAISIMTSMFNQMRSSFASLAKSAATFAPGIAMVMEMTLRDLDAVIGAYSAKVGQAMIPMIRAVADYLYPAMTALGEVVAAVVKSLTPFVTVIMQYLAPVITFLATVFKLLWDVLSPVVSLLASAGKILGGIFALFTALATALVDLLSMALSPLLNVINFVVESFSQAIDVFFKFTASLLSFIPIIGKRFEDALNPKSTVGLGAANSAKIGNFGGIGDTAAQNAFLATSGNVNPSDKFAQEMLDNDVPKKIGGALGKVQGQAPQAVQGGGWFGAAANVMNGVAAAGKALGAL